MKETDGQVVADRLRATITLLRRQLRHTHTAELQLPQLAA